MRYGVFLFFSNVSQGTARELVRHEDGVISETAFTGPVICDAALQGPFEKVFLPVKYKGYHTPEARPAGIPVHLHAEFLGHGAFSPEQVKLGNQLVNVLPEILALTGVSGCMYARGSAQSTDFQTGVIGETAANVTPCTIGNLLPILHGPKV